MKKIGIILCIILFILAVGILAAGIYKRHKTYYLNLQFYTCLSEKTTASWVEVEPSWMEVSSGIKLKGYPEAEGYHMTRISDRQAINKVIDYLNIIPLTFVKEGEEDFISLGEGCSLKFYTKNGQMVGAVWIDTDNNIWNWATVTKYKAKNSDTSIISCLENLDLK